MLYQITDSGLQEVGLMHIEFYPMDGCLCAFVHINLIYFSLVQFHMLKCITTYSKKQKWHAAA